VDGLFSFAFALEQSGDVLNVNTSTDSLGQRRAPLPIRRVFDALLLDELRRFRS